MKTAVRQHLAILMPASSVLADQKGGEKAEWNRNSDNWVINNCSADSTVYVTQLNDIQDKKNLYTYIAAGGPGWSGPSEFLAIKPTGVSDAN